MPYANHGINSIEAGEDLSAKDHYIVQLDATGKLEVGEGATDLLVGVQEPQGNPGGTGTHATYQHQGIAKVIAGGSIGVGAWVTSDGSGKAVATTNAGDVVIGRALEAADSGDMIAVQLSIFRY